MERVDSRSFPQRDRAGLVKFLTHCQKRAIERSHPQIASISLEARHLDPLAVLQAIYVPGERHCYLEKPSSEEALAGADALIELVVAGNDRFVNGSDQAHQWLNEAVAIGDIHLPFSGPHFFCAFPFVPGRVGCPIKDGVLFLPRWQVARKQGDCVAVANCLIDEQSDVEAEAIRILAAHGKLSSGRYDEKPPPIAGTLHREADDGTAYPQLVQQALHAIESGEIEKVVVARTSQLVSDIPFHPLGALHRLRESHPNCFCFSFADDAGGSFVGATPERLVRQDANGISSEAIAGSVGRGTTAGEDAHLAWQLLGSEKDLREHRIVVDYIRTRLESLGLSVSSAEKPRILTLGNVQHLHTPVSVEGTLGNVSLLQLAAALHPTPAVGGVPVDRAVQYIVGWEAFDRGLYTGVLGWIDAEGNGEMVVPLRTARIAGNHATLFAGAGIVRGSDPAAEQRETEIKLIAMERALAT